MEKPFIDCGIANVLNQHSLVVPLNQRPYKWTTDEVKALYENITDAFKTGEQIYFLGMIVLTEGMGGKLEVADGQQRLATISILIAAIRDYLVELRDDQTVSKYENKYLFEYDEHTGDFIPKLLLNFDDRDFFYKTILLPPNRRERFNGTKVTSHERLEAAATIASTHIRNMVALFTEEKERKNRLYNFIDYLNSKATVIVGTVSGDVGNAFKMFETLNARGMKASQIDILKNYLFNLGKNRIGEIQPRWSSMLNTINDQLDPVDEDEVLIDFIRFYWIAHNGPTTERELGQKIRDNIKDERPAHDLVLSLDSFANDFAALNTPRDHPQLEKFNRHTRNCIYTITKELGARQILPLMLAILRYFDTPQAEKAFRLCLSWTVRFLIVGGAGGGVLERYYGLRAKEISTFEITTADELVNNMSKVVHGNRAFQEAFEVATIRQIKLARYYLRAIESYLAKDPNPQFLPNDDTKAVNAEHVLPLTLTADWDITPDLAASYNKRLGNIVLLKSKDNVKLANKKFTDKKIIYKESPFLTTQWVSKYSKWGPDEIRDRQKELAAVVHKVWPI
jgi:hypothetical protein